MINDYKMTNTYFPMDPLIAAKSTHMKGCVTFLSLMFGTKQKRQLYRKDIFKPLN